MIIREGGRNDSEFEKLTTQNDTFQNEVWKSHRNPNLFQIKLINLPFHLQMPYSIEKFFKRLMGIDDEPRRSNKNSCGPKLVREPDFGKHCSTICN